MTHACPMCKKEFKLKSGFEQHKKRKTPCVKAVTPPPSVDIPPSQKAPKLQRLNYIGSKYQLLDWITEQMIAKTGFESLSGKSIADCFAGTGIVSYFLRMKGCKVLANDAELYSAVITRAYTCESWSPAVQDVIDQLNKDLSEKKYIDTNGYITTNYSPKDECERMFFTVDNAKRIDYCREKITTLSSELQPILLASLLLSADAVANIPAVYGCYLKKFKAKAEVPFVMRPAHTSTSTVTEGSSCTQYNVATMPTIQADIAYLDPPYNERQYSKNYFPLNMIVQPSLQPLKGKTGIPEECFLSPFCQKNKVAGAFRDVLKRLDTSWVFISYNSESLLKKDDMLKILGEFGEASVVEREYKRFKSFEYNEDKSIHEYLFCLRPTNTQNGH